MAGSEGVDNKLPSWDGDWMSFEDYKLRCTLRADATKSDELSLLGPRLAANLTNKAFDCLPDIDRESLKKPDGWKYLMKFLEERRGKEKVDVLGDLFAEFFTSKTSFRKDGEDLSDFENRFKQLVRRLEKAMKETNPKSQMPSELLGWYLLNVYMRLDPSDAANVRGKTESYCLSDVLAALRKMWSGSNLSMRDQERKKKGSGNALRVQEPSEDKEENDGIFVETGTEGTSVEEPEELEETAIWYQEALSALIEEPEDGTILANYQEARRALDHARVSRGFIQLETQTTPVSEKGMIEDSKEEISLVVVDRTTPTKFVFAVGRRDTSPDFAPRSLQV